MTTTAQVLNIVIEEGTGYVLSLTWTDKLTNLPKNLTGYTAKLQVRVDYNPTSTVLLEKSTTNGKIILGGTTGFVDVIFDATDTLGLTWSKAIYDLLLVPASGAPVKLVKGEFIVQQTVTVLP